MAVNWKAVKVAASVVLCVSGVAMFVAVCSTPLGLASVESFIELCLGGAMVWIGLTIGLMKMPHSSAYETLRDMRPISDCEAIERNEVNSLFALKAGLMGSFGYTSGFDFAGDHRDSCNEKWRRSR